MLYLSDTDPYEHIYVEPKGGFKERDCKERDCKVGENRTLRPERSWRMAVSSCTRRWSRTLWSGLRLLLPRKRRCWPTERWLLRISDGNGGPGSLAASPSILHCR